MATKRYPLEQETIKAEAIKHIVNGLSDADVAAALSTKKVTVSRQAITAFRHRHVAEIAPKVEEVVAQVQTAMLVDKEARLNELEWLYGLAKAEAMEYGVAVTEVRYEDDGETRIETRDFRGGMVKEMRGLLHDIAEQSGQLPRGPSVNIDNRTQVLIRQVTGVGDDIPLG